MYRDVLKVYDQDCVIYDSGLDGTAYDVDSIKSNIDRETTWQFNWHVWFAMMIIWVLIFIFNSCSVRTIEPLAAFSWTFSLIFMFMFLIKANTLGNGIHSGVHEFIWGRAEASEESYDVWAGL